MFTAARLLASSASKLRFSQPVLLFLVARLANKRLDTVMTPPSLADQRRTNAGLVYRSGQRASHEQTQLHLCLQREAISASGYGIWQNECFSEIPAKLESVNCRARFSVLAAEYGHSVDLCFYIGCHGNKMTQSGCGNVITLPSICRQEKSWPDTTLLVVVIKIHSKIHTGA